MQVILMREHKHARQLYRAGSAIDVTDAEAAWLIEREIAGLPFTPGEIVADHEQHEELDA